MVVYVEYYKIFSQNEDAWGKQMVVHVEYVKIFSQNEAALIFLVVFRLKQIEM